MSNVYCAELLFTSKQNVKPLQVHTTSFMPTSRHGENCQKAVGSKIFYEIRIASLNAVINQFCGVLLKSIGITDIDNDILVLICLAQICSLLTKLFFEHVEL